MRSKLCAATAFAAALALVACDDGGAPLATSNDGGATSAASSSGHTSSHAASTGAGGAPEDPVADAGPDQRVEPGAIVTLDASASHTADQTGLAYQWVEHDGPNVELSNPQAETPTFTAPLEAGDKLTFTLYATALDGEIASDDVVVQVKAPPTASAGPDVEAAAGATVTLHGFVSEPDGDVVTTSWKQTAGPAAKLDDPSSLTPSFVLPIGLTTPIVFELVASDVDGSSAPSWATAVAIDGLDSDGDLLDDATEVALGTDPHDPDTDHDGIPDGWEVLGHGPIDYAAMGCDPLHRDLLVEIDWQEKTDGGVTTSARPGDALLDAVTSYYANVPIDNPDGAPGIAYHYVLNDVIPADALAPGPITHGSFPTTTDPRYAESFHVMMMWLTGFSQGIAEIGGRQLHVSVAAPDADPSNDLDEEAVFDAYIIMLHEMGHNLGLQHGGADAINWKPNYPSYMNYEFGYAIDGSPHTISGTKLALSRGLLPSVNECALDELGAFGSVPVTATHYLSELTTPWVVEADGSVDWNRNGSIDTSPTEAIVRSSTLEWASPNFPDCQLLQDSDDVATIAAHMADGLPSNPNAVHPEALHLAQKHAWIP